MSAGIDYGWGGPPSAQSLRSAGIRWVGRYFSFDGSKNLTAAEYRFLRGLGIGVVVVWETTAERARGDEAAGRSDAMRAEEQRRACGMPPTQPIHFAVDFEAVAEQCDAYFRGVHKVLGTLRTGAYGSYEIVKDLFDAGLISHGWQTYAWSHGKWDRRATFRQWSNGHVLGGVSCDYDVMLEPPPTPMSTYIPADEARWIREYDGFRGKHTPWAVLRTRVLRRYMGRRREEIYRLANPHQWNVLNRYNRYIALRNRTR